MPRPERSTQTFTAHLRGNPAGLPAWRRQEELALHETSIAYRLVALKRRLGSPAGLTLDEREQRLREVRGDPLYERVEKLRGSDLYKRVWNRGKPPAADPSPAPAAEQSEAPAEPPQLSPALSRRVDLALDLLRTIPFEELQRRGWHFQPNHFYWPLNNVDFLYDNADLWHDRGIPRGIDWRIDEQLELVRAASAHKHELDDAPIHPTEGKVEFVWENNAFGGADAAVHYGLMREWKPKRVLEIGCGWSSLLLDRAIKANGTPTEVIQIEPFPNRELLDALPGDWERHEAIIQRADLALFERLEAGDVLFYDGSHCVGTATDVNWFFFEVLPRVKPGVRIHVHDLLFPDDYHDNWIYDEGLSWNEQYLVQAFLMHNDAYRVLAANHLLYAERPEEIKALHGMDGGSVWLEKLR